MTIEEEKKLPVDDTSVETVEAETTGELDQAEMDNVSGGRLRAL